VRLYNKYLKGWCNHQRYLWIQKIGRLEKGRHPHDRFIWVGVINVPLLAGAEKYSKSKRFRYRQYSITTFMRRAGYEIAVEGVKYYKGKEAWHAVYVKLGLIPRLNQRNISKVA